MVAGILPVRLLLLSESVNKKDRLPTVPGIPPVSPALLLKERFLIPVRSPISGGMLPMRLLPFRNKPITRFSGPPKTTPSQVLIGCAG